MRRLLNLLPGFVLLFAFTTASVPVEKAEASATSKFTQVILEPDCYDYVSNTTGTMDYIATFDCQYRRPDGTATGKSVNAEMAGRQDRGVRVAAN